jgi:hypothetical protein
LHIFNLCSWECDSFKVAFSLWGQGGPRFDQEVSLWEKEEEAMQMVTNMRRKGPRSFVDVVHQNCSLVLTGANVVPLSHHSRSAARATHGRKTLVSLCSID